MPEKEGSEDEKTTKGVVNKKQKQIMNQEDYIPEQEDSEDSSMNVQKKKSTSELRREIVQRNVERAKRRDTARDDKRRSDAIQAKSTFNQAAEYATKQRPKIGGGERPDLKSKGGSASTGTSDIKIGGPKKDPKSAGGKSKGNTPVKVDIKKKPDLSKYFGDEYIPEEGYDIARDRGMVKPSKDKKDATTMPPSKEMEKTRKVYKGPSALELVKASITKKYGKGAIMDVKKKGKKKGKKKVKEELDLTKVAEAFGGYIIEEPVDDNQRTGRRVIKKKIVTGDGTVRVGGEKKDKKPTRTKQTSFDMRVQTGDPDYYRKKRKELEAKRDEYEFKKNKYTGKYSPTEAGIEKYARRKYSQQQRDSKSNEPFTLTKDQLASAEKDMILKYGGRDAKRQSLLDKLNKKSRTRSFVGDTEPKVEKPKPDRVTTGDDRKTDTRSGGSPETKTQKTTFAKIKTKLGSTVSRVANFAKANPAAALAAYDFLKLNVPKIPPVRGGRAGMASARGGGGL